jgi:hypothetical protein
MKTIVLLVLVLFGTTTLLAFPALNIMQSDTIIKLNSEKIICTVREIGTTEIKYSSPEFSPELLFTIESKMVDRIVFSDGKVKIIDHELSLNENIERNTEDLFLWQRKNAFKIDFISPALNTTSLTYERCLNPGTSVEFSLGAVGLGIADMKDNASGILFRGGYKLIRSPDYFLRDMRYAHILKGRYVKFEFDFASYNVEGSRDQTETPNNEYTLNKWALLIVLGNQWVFNDSFLIDLYSGIGIGKNNENDFHSSYPYGFLASNGESPLAFSLGLRIGILIK